MTISSRLRALALTALLGALVLGCGSDQDGPGTSPAGSRPSSPSGLDVTYVVVGVTEGGKRRALVEDSEIRLAFADGQLRITAGCNTMSGGYRLEGTRLTVEPLAGTEMGCEQALMDQDAWVAGLFTDPVRLTTGNDAALISGDVVLTLADRETSSPDRRLEGTRWVLDTLIDADTASSVPSGVEAYLQIDGGRVVLKDGCNTGSGTVEVSGDVLVVDQTTRTRIACPGAETVEGAFVAVFDGAATYAIEEDRLTVTHDGRGLGFRAADRE